MALRRERDAAAPVVFHDDAAAAGTRGPEARHPEVELRRLGLEGRDTVGRDGTQDLVVVDKPSSASIFARSPTNPSETSMAARACASAGRSARRGRGSR